MHTVKIKLNMMKNKNIFFLKRFRGIFPTRHNKLRLDANERISSFSKKFIETIKKKITGTYLTAYPETEEIYDLLSTQYKLDRSNFMLTAGSDMGIRHCFETFTTPQSKIITLSPTFGMVNVYSKIYQTKQIKISYDKNLNLDINNLFKSISKKIDLIMIANPNSPTGTHIEKINIIKILKLAKKNRCVVIIDEAYYGFYKNSYIKLIKKFNNLIILRTFSKAFGLAGIRAGFIVSNKTLIKKMYSFRPMYEINSLACLIIKEIYKNKKLVSSYIQKTLDGKKYLIKQLNQLKIKHHETFTNFILIDFSNRGNLDRIKKYLKKEKILARKAPNIRAFRHYLRFTLGPVEYMKKVNKVIKKTIK